VTGCVSSLLGGARRGERALGRRRASKTQAIGRASESDGHRALLASATSRTARDRSLCGIRLSASVEPMTLRVARRHYSHRFEARCGEPHSTGDA